MKTIDLTTLEELAAFAGEFLKDLPQGAVVGLSGGLGAGKTAFVREIVRQLCQRAGVREPRVTSPTFVIHQSYPEIRVDHFDLYRLDKVTDESLLHIGYPEALERARTTQGYLFVEWAEKAEAGGTLGLNVRLTIELIGHQRRIHWAY